VGLLSPGLGSETWPAIRRRSLLPIPGATQASLVIRWQTAEERWTQEPLDQTFPFETGEGEWQQAFGVVTVPEGAGRLMVLLSVRGQRTDEDVCWFDNLGVYRVLDSFKARGRTAKDANDVRLEEKQGDGR
jgi:hypothetical protein